MANEQGGSGRGTPDLERIREIAREHDAIRAILHRIERELDRLLDHPARAGERWELPALARSLDEHLEAHFAREESEGLLGSAARGSHPPVQAAAERLVAEHREFERRMLRILDELASVSEPAAIVQSCFDGEIRKLVSGMARHEARENELLDELVARARPGERGASSADS